jgi:SAM-dependent methyltransferase
MTEDRSGAWNDYYRSHDRGSVCFDHWIEKHGKFFGEGRSVVEFGCGFGYVTEALLAMGCRVLATDASAVALKKLKECLPAAQAMVVDLSRPFPFPDGAFDCAVADLCLHYFDGRTTAEILLEIARILVPRGFLLCRVNSSQDVHFGAGAGFERERGFYDRDGRCKRFFDEAMIGEFFAEWEMISLKRYDMRGYGQPKNLYEIVLQKKEERSTAAAMRSRGVKDS